MATTLDVVPLDVATILQVKEAVDACVAAPQDRNQRVERWLEFQSNPTFSPATVSLLHDPEGMVGWVGVIPYPEISGAWQSSTYLAPRWRGKGLVPFLRAYQQDLATQLLPPDITLTTSVAIDNIRSLKACHKYAEAEGWPPGVITTEHARKRVAVVWRWP